MRQLVILKDRYTENYQLLRAMAVDENNSVADRLNTLASMKVLADSIAKLYRDAPAISAIQRRRLEYYQKGAVYLPSEKAYLPPPPAITRSPASGTSIPFGWESQPPESEPEQQQQDSDFLPGELSEEESNNEEQQEEERRDHWQQ